MQNLLLTPNIARELLTDFEQFTKFNKEEVDGLNFEQFQKLLLAYGALYFNTKDVDAVLKELADLAASGEQALPTAAVPNADRLKELVEEHDRLVQEKTAGRADEWIRQQQAVVEKKLEEADTAASVVYQSEEGAQAESTPAPLSGAIGTLSVPPDEVGDFAKNQRVENLERVLAEADIPQEFRHETAEQLDQVLGLVQSEGVSLTQEALRERVFSIVSRTTNQPPTQETVSIIAERIPQPRPVGAPASPFEPTPRSLRPVISQPREERTAETSAIRADRGEQFAYLALRGEPYWRQLGNQLLPYNWFGREVNRNYLVNLQAIKAKIERVRAEQPREFARSIQTLLAAEQRVDELIAQNSPGPFPELERRLDSVEVILPEAIESASPEQIEAQNGAIQAILNDPSQTIVQMGFNPQTRAFEIAPATKEEIVQSLPRLQASAPQQVPISEAQQFTAQEVKRQQRQERAGTYAWPSEAQQFTTQEVSRQARVQAQTVRKNLFSWASIKLKQLFTNPNLGWLRWSLSGALAATIPFLPTSAAILAAGGSGSLALAQLKFAGGVLKNVGMLVAKIAGVSLGPIGLAASAALNFAEPFLKAAKWIFIGFFAILAFLVFFAITLFHGIFVKETTTSAPSQSKYISISKTATPSGLQNSNLPAEISYSVTVGAKDKALKNIRFTDKVSVSGKNNPAIPSVRTPPAPDTLAPGASHTFAYTISLDQTYQDSLVTNTAVLIADVEGGPSGESATKTATVTIGTPPTNCPAGWPTSGYVNQGPEGSTSHTGAEAVDIHNITGTQITAPLDGFYLPFEDNNNIGKGRGKDIEVYTTCNGQRVRITFVHLSVWLIPIGGKNVKRGEVIGLMGETGEAHSPHLHYQFRGIPMAPPYIPQAVPRGCVGKASCGNIQF